MNQTSQLSLYLFFHLNLFFSSIEKHLRPLVIEKCYWPLLHLIEKSNLNIGIEASAYTLETITRIDSSWTNKLKSLLSSSRCTFIGSGYSQLIGPLVPAIINSQNLQLGNEIYKQLLGITPSIGLVNEQAWSKGLVDIYLDAGYVALIMEWDNPASCHPEWDQSLQYFPQFAIGSNNRKIKLIWNHSISFQKLQRYIHGELSMEDYLQYLDNLHSPSCGYFSMYGNDAEIFNFRPGRFNTESQPAFENEWDNLLNLLLKVRDMGRYRFVSPTDLLSCRNHKMAWQPLELQSTQHPIPVKKQPKYNICRWAVTGRDNTALNTACYKIYNYLLSLPANANLTKEWETLCYLWSSDFRTHITELRFKEVQQQLIDQLPQTPKTEDTSRKPKLFSARKKDWISLHQDQRYIHCNTAALQVTIDTWKGLAIKELTFPRLSPVPVVGTLPHGYFENIAYGADFFTGHLVYTTPGSPQITDLSQVVPVIHRHKDKIDILSQIQLTKGRIYKKITLKREAESLEISYTISLNRKPHGTIRLGYTTLNPKLFQRESLYFSTHNGGKHSEVFPLNNTPTDHFKPVSPIVTSSQCLGETEGTIVIGDTNLAIRITTDKTISYSVGGIYFVPLGNTYLLRHIFSILETDDTNNHYFSSRDQQSEATEFSFTISPA